MAPLVIRGGGVVADLRKHCRCADDRASEQLFYGGEADPVAVIRHRGSFFIDPARYSFAAPPPYTAFSQAAMLLVFAYTGFEVSIISAGENARSARDVPFALLTGIALVVMLYVSIQAR